MARPTKQGIDYFPLDCQFDDKIELLIVEKGGVALAIIITIFQLIYQNEGYYIKNGKNLLLLIKRRVGFDLPLIEDIITAAIDQEIFNKKLHKKHNILTSNGIQKRYFTAARLKKKIKIIKNYLLADVSNVGNAIYIGIKSVGNATNVKGEVKEEGEVEGEVKKPFVEQDSTIDEIILYLNKKAEKNFKLTTVKYWNLIKAKLKDYSVEEIKTVIDRKCKQWINTEHDNYLRPETLFGNKFESYINEKDINQTVKCDISKILNKEN